MNFQSRLWMETRLTLTPASNLRTLSGQLGRPGRPVHVLVLLDGRQVQGLVGHQSGEVWMAAKVVTLPTEPAIWKTVQVMSCLNSHPETPFNLSVPEIVKYDFKTRDSYFADMVDEDGFLKIELKNAFGESCASNSLDQVEHDNWRRDGVDIFESPRDKQLLGNCNDFRVPSKVCTKDPWFVPMGHITSTIQSYLLVEMA